MAIVLDGTANTVTPLNGALGATTPSTVAATTVVASSTIKGATTIAVGNATPSASGAGITFPATQSASTDANTLDDYEEGTWTPNAGSTGGNSTGQTYAVQQGNYRKIGSLVICSFYIDLTTVGTIPAGTYAVKGLPFNSASGTIGTGSINYIIGSNVAAYSFLLSMEQNNNVAYTNTLTSAPSTSVTNSNIWKNGMALQGTIIYFTS
jgi:hypothetical protein